MIKSFWSNGRAGNPGDDSALQLGGDVLSRAGSSPNRALARRQICFLMLRRT